MINFKLGEKKEDLNILVKNINTRRYTIGLIFWRKLNFLVHHSGMYGGEMFKEFRDDWKIAVLATLHTLSYATFADI